MIYNVLFKKDNLFSYLWRMNVFCVFNVYIILLFKRGLVADLKAHMSIGMKETNLILRFNSTFVFWDYFFCFPNERIEKKKKKKLKLMRKCIRFKLYMETFSQRYTSRLHLHLSAFIRWPVVPLKAGENLSFVFVKTTLMLRTAYIIYWKWNLKIWGLL